MSKNKKYKDNRQAFLLSFFDQEDDQYTEKEVNGFFLVKQLNGATKKWMVAIFPKDSFQRYNQNKLGLEDLNEGFKRNLLDD